MKKSINYLLMAALMCSLSLTVTSCKDDDKNEANNEQQEQQEGDQNEKALKFWGVVGELVSMDNYTESYENKTFEPTIGEADDNDANTRIVYTNTAEAAAKRFASLVDLEEFDENTASYTWSDPDVGTLTYTKVNDGTAWAKVDVSIKQVPHLSKIIYREPSQDDANADKEYVANHGRAYYRFGDVVCRKVKDKDGSTIKEYWICVRPAFDMEKKGNSHWMTVSPLTEANKFRYTTKTHQQNFVLPTGLSDSKEHMQNMAEMLYAIYNPDKWYKNVEQYANSGMHIFEDFSKKNIQYHNNLFWKGVQKGWRDKNIARLVFGQEENGMEKMISNNGLYLLYAGYSWHYTLSNDLSLFQAHFVNTPGGKNANMQTAKPYTKVTKTVLDKKDESGKNDIVINLDEDYTAEQPYLINYSFFDDNTPRYIVRYATDKQLSETGKYDNNQKQIPGVENVYRYYHDIVPCTAADLKKAPEITGEKDIDGPAHAPAEGDAGTYMLGDVLTDFNGARWFCISGSPYHKDNNPLAEDKSAWFITFDVETAKGMNRDGFPITEEDLPEVSYRLMIFIQTLATATTDYQLDLEKGKLGKIGQHILDYAKVDLRKLYNTVDSTWTFTSKGKTWASESRSTLFNIAYDQIDGSNVPIARCIIDRTQAGTKRGDCVAASGKKYADWFYLCHKYYESYMPDRIELTDDEVSLGMAPWHARWPVTSVKMNCQDVNDQDMVNTYAPGDKWQKNPRKTAESGVGISEYYWDAYYGKFKSKATSIFKEPVLAFFVMKITDNGGRYPNTKSQNGCNYRISHLQNDENLYRAGLQALPSIIYNASRKKLFYLDNKLYEIKAIPGMDQ